MKIDATKLLKGLKIDNFKPKKIVNRLPRIKWANSKRYYVYCYAATTNRKTADKVCFTEECLDRMVKQNLYSHIPCYYDFDKNKVIGSGKFSGLTRDNENDIVKLITNIVVVAPPEIAEKLNNANIALSVSVSEQIENRNGIVFIKKCKVNFLSIIDKSKSPDKFCTIFQILKDEDIDRRLEE